MTAPTEEGTVELQPCPHCGHAHAPEVITSASLRDEDDEYSWPHSDSFAVICSAARPDGRGGCGAMGGFFSTEAEAIAAWNRRASRSPVVGAVGGEPQASKLVPLEPTDEMWGGLARDILMWMDMGDRPTPRKLFQHLKNLGRDIPAWLASEPEMSALDHVPSKGTRAVLIYKAMVNDAPASPTAAGPMTEERIDAVVEKLFPPPDIGTGYHKAWLREIAVPIARAIEAAHGIGVSPTGSPEGEVK